MPDTITPFKILMDSLRDAELLVQDDSCVWLRSRIGIVGMVQIDEQITAVDLTRDLNDKITYAHAQLERLKADELSLDDLWNLILFISVPWTGDEIARFPAVAAILARCARNLQGSRKVILYKGISPSIHVGDFSATQQAWIPKIGEPLRAEIHAKSLDDVERDALEILFKRRITDNDLNFLIKVLGRKPNI